jgi:hypothetical protein
LPHAVPERRHERRHLVSGPERHQLAGRLHRVTYTDRVHLVAPQLADHECEHGLIGACLECDIAPTDAGRSMIARGHWSPENIDAPATLADFECEHLVIGLCPTCVAETITAARVCPHGRDECPTCELAERVELHGRHVQHDQLAWTL